MVINHWVVMNRNVIARDGVPLQVQDHDTPEQVYSALECNYPKFYKMDKLCKWAFVASEYLFSKGESLYKGIDKSKIAVALVTSHGCIDVDKRFYEGMAVPSPALFVYTLPNIMLGEICIRNGFKGEQVCMVAEQFDAAELYFAVKGFLNSSGMEACLCGWANTSADNYDLCMFWITNKGAGLDFTPAVIQQLYNTHHSGV